jgi:uncharacterized membrane protein YkvA (DUF1232 family)
MERPTLLDRAGAWARAFKRDIVVLWLAARDPRVPRTAKLLAGMVAAYALSPIDLIPDFIPVLGYLDDIVILPLGIMLAVKLIPPKVLAELRERAATIRAPRSLSGLAAILMIWISVAGAAFWIICSAMER